MSIKVLISDKMDPRAAEIFRERGIEVDEAQLTAQKEALEAQIEGESSALFATGRVWDDGIIHPNDTRTVLGLALSAAHSNVVAGTSEYGVWRH